MPEATRENGTDRRQLPTRTAVPVSIRTATPRIEAYPVGGAYATERRDLASRQALSRRIAMDYDELSRGRGATLRARQGIRWPFGDARFETAARRAERCNAGAL